jgi:hypothetical protein
VNAPEPRRVLITTRGLESNSGSDLYTRDLALALLRRGWQPVVYSPYLGAIAEELRQATIPVTSDITGVAVTPDVIHGHHHLETLAALARFPGVPALFVCHDGLTWHSTPPATPRIGVYVAVDRNCRDRLTMEHGIDERVVRVLLNAVDLQRFKRRPPLPPKPRRALVFSNQASRENFASIIENACSQRGISLDIAGRMAGTAVEHPEKLLPQYDIVFAKARCALEAAAVGAAVVLCDSEGLAGMVTASDVDAMRELNFGRRLLQRTLTLQTAGVEIDRYDPVDAARVTDSIRATAGAGLLAEQFIELYDELLLNRVAIAPEDDLLAMGTSLSNLARYIEKPAAVPESLLRSLSNAPSLRLPVQFLRRLKKRLRS